MGIKHSSPVKHRSWLKTVGWLWGCLGFCLWMVIGLPSLPNPPGVPQPALAQEVFTPVPLNPEGGLTLVLSTPAHQGQGLPLDGMITLEFNQLLPSDVQALELQLRPETDILVKVDQNRLQIQPQEAWRYSTQYTLTIPPQALLPLKEPLELTFRTVPQFTYTDHVKPLLEISCVGCHQSAGRQRIHPLETYEGVMKYVTPGDPASILLEPRWTGRHAVIFRAQVGPDGKVTGPGRSPEIAYVTKKGTPVNRLGFWTPEEIELVRTWIVQDLAAESQP